MARTAAAWARYWADTVDTIPTTGVDTRLAPARIEAFPHDRILADMRARPWKYDESFMDHIQQMRDTWLFASDLTEWDCADCGTWHLTPDAEFHTDTPCPGPSAHSVLTRHEPNIATPASPERPPYTGDKIVHRIVPTSADLPDLPDDATPEQIAAWREQFTAMRAARPPLRG